LLPLAVLAAGLPLFVWGSLRDQIVLPRLAASCWLAGVTLIALSWTDAWSRVPWRALAWPCALLASLVAVSAVATAAGADPLRSLLGEQLRYQGLLPLVMYASMMVAALAATACGGTSRPLLAGMFVGGTLSAGYALLQRLGLDWVHWTGLPAGRIGGAFGQPDVLGIELVAAAAASTGLLQGAGPRARVIIGGGVALMLLALLLTLSRGAWIGAAAAGVVLLIFYIRRLPPWRSLWYVVPAVVLVVGVGVAIPTGRAALGAAVARAGSAGNFGETAVSQRIGLWRTSLEMAADRPILGAGPDSFPVLFASYRTPDQPGIGTANVRPESSHNVFLDQLVDTGVVGLLVLLGLIGVCVWMGVRALPVLDAAPRAAVAGMMSALAGYYAAVFFSLSQAMTGWLPWVLMGAIVGVAASASASAQPAGVPAAWRAPVTRAAWAAAGAALVVAGLALVLADLSAGRAGRAAQRRDITGAVDGARAATRWNPLEPQYLLELGFYEEAAGARVGPEHRDKALSAYHRLNTWFEPTAFGLVREAQAQADVAFSTPEDKDRVFSLLERAASLDPYNAELRRGIADFYASAGEDARASVHRAAVEAMQSGKGGGNP